MYSSHAVAELERICDYLIVLRSRQKRLAGDIDELRQQHRVICGTDGWKGGGGWQVISQRSMAGRTTALVRCDGAHLDWRGPAGRAHPPLMSSCSATSKDDAATLPEEATGMTGLIWRQHRGQDAVD